MKERRLWVRLRMGLIVLCMMLLTVGMNAFAADEIKIGVIGPMKFTMGEHIWLGTQIAADEINAAGGIRVKGKKYRIEVIKTDDNEYASLTDAINAMERLVTLDKVNFVIGGHRTEAVLAQEEVMADNKIIYLGTGAAEACLKIAKDYDRYKYFFRVTPTQGSPGPNAAWPMYAAMLEPVMRAVKTELGIERPKVALLVEKGKWADFFIVYARDVFLKMGCEVVGEWRPGFTATSVTAELSAIKSAGAQIIFQVTAGPAGNIISKQWGELKIPAALIGLGVEAGKETHWKATDGLCNFSGSSEAIVNIVKNKKTKPFVDTFVKKSGENPMYAGSGSYDAVYILKEAIEKAGTLNAEALIPVLEKTDYVGPDGRIVFTPPGHNFPHGCIVGPHHYDWVGFQWRDGKRMVYWPDGHEIHPALIAAGIPREWGKVRYKGTTDYVLPPWVVEYWKGKK